MGTGVALTMGEAPTPDGVGSVRAMMRWVLATAVAAMALIGARWIPGYIASGSATAPPHAGVSAPGYAAARGELRQVDRGLLSLGTERGTVTFETNDRTVWRQGARVIDPADVVGLRGTAAKVRYRGGDQRRVADSVTIAPEQVVGGRLSAYDPATASLSLTNDSGSRAYILDGQTSCRVGRRTVPAGDLPQYVGRSIKLTTSKQTRRVIVVSVEEPNE